MRLLSLLAACVVAGLGVSAHATTINLDVNRDSNSTTYSGTAQAPDAGTVWNDWTNPGNNAITHTITGVMDSTGAATSSDITISQIEAGQILRTWSNSTAGNPNPVDLMSDYLYAWGLYEVEITNLPAGPYALYAYGHGDGASGQNGTFNIDPANGGDPNNDEGQLTNDGDYRDIFQSGRVEALGNSYLKLWGSVANDGDSFKFTTTYLNGFQLHSVPEPSALLLCVGALGLAVVRKRA